MEQGEVTGYDQVDRIDRIRRANAQKHIVPSSYTCASLQLGKKTHVKVGRSMPCQFFNQGSCSHANTHETRGVLIKWSKTLQNRTDTTAICIPA